MRIKFPPSHWSHAVKCQTTASSVFAEFGCTVQKQHNQFNLVVFVIHFIELSFFKWPILSRQVVARPDLEERFKTVIKWGVFCMLGLSMLTGFEIKIKMRSFKKAHISVGYFLCLLSELNMCSEKVSSIKTNISNKFLCQILKIVLILKFYSDSVFISVSDPTPKTDPPFSLWKTKMMFFELWDLKNNK